MSKLCPICKGNVRTFREFLTNDTIFIIHSKAPGVKCEASLMRPYAARMLFYKLSRPTSATEGSDE